MPSRALRLQAPMARRKVNGGKPGLNPMRLLPLVLCLLFTATAASAMEFRVSHYADGYHVVIGNGPIVRGDAARLREALAAADRFPETRTKTLALNSPGGSVDEALAMVRVMDQVGVTTVVPPGMSCASACAAVVFVSGTYRTVMDGGRLGLHSCSVSGQPAPECNDEVAHNALAHGVAYGSVAAFMTQVSPRDVLWLDARDADCWGLSRWPPAYRRGVQPGQVAECVRDAINQPPQGARNRRPSAPAASAR